MIDRRQILGTALMSSPLLFAGPALARGSARRFARQGLTIGAQIYTVAAAARRDPDLAFTRLAAIGYQTIELPGLLGHTPRALRAASDRAGLRIVSIGAMARASGDVPGLAGDLVSEIDTFHELGVEHVVMVLMLPPLGLAPAPGESEAGFFTRASAALRAEDWKRTAAFLNDRGERLKRAGLRLAYHNHTAEFTPLFGQTGWEILMRETDPALVDFELDAGWAAVAGARPAELLRKARGRVPLMHVKDFRPSAQGTFGLPFQFVAAGSGVLDWREILASAVAAGVRSFLVELEPPFENDPFGALGRSFSYLQSFNLDPRS